MKKQSSLKIKFPLRFLKFSLLIMMYFGMLWAVKAATHTVDNKTGALADYSSLQDAIDAATAGDIILIAGSGTSYGNVTIEKKLTLIGAGFQHTDTQLGRVTTLGQINLPDNSAATDSYFTGFTASFIVGENVGVEIERCYVTSATLDNGSNTLIRHCVTGAVTNGAPNTGVTYPLTLLIQNSVLLGYVNSGNDQASVLIDHCNIVNNGQYALSYYGLNYATVSNSIFFRKSGTNCSYTSFSNNLTYSTDGALADLVTGTNTGGNNIENTDPLFTTVLNGVAFAFTNDYRLQTGSPGIGQASDGTDIGIYGGSNPYPIASGDNLLTPAPKNPQIYEMNVLNATVPENGTLNIQVKARKID